MNAEKTKDAVARLVVNNSERHFRRCPGPIKLARAFRTQAFHRHIGYASLSLYIPYIFPTRYTADQSIFQFCIERIKHATRCHVTLSFYCFNLAFIFSLHSALRSYSSKLNTARRSLQSTCSISGITLLTPERQFPVF